jgi:hypothetical protein
MINPPKVILNIQSAKYNIKQKLHALDYPPQIQVVFKPVLNSGQYVVSFEADNSHDFRTDNQFCVRIFRRIGE